MLCRRQPQNSKRILGLVGFKQNTICIFVGCAIANTLLFAPVLIDLLYTSFLQRSQLQSRLPLHGDIVGSSPLTCCPNMTSYTHFCCAARLRRARLIKWMLTTDAVLFLDLT